MRRDATGCRKDVTNGNDNGTDGQTDRVRRNMRPPPREEGRIINFTADLFVYASVSFACLLTYLYNVHRNVPDVAK